MKACQNTLIAKTFDKLESYLSQFKENKKRQGTDYIFNP